MSALVPTMEMPLLLGGTDVDPHSFLLDLVRTPTAALQGQTEVATLLRSGRTIDPDGAGPVWEVPISDPSVLLDLNDPFPALRP